MESEDRNLKVLYKQYSGMCEQMLLLLLQSSRKNFGVEIKQC